MSGRNAVSEIVDGLDESDDGGVSREESGNEDDIMSEDEDWEENEEEEDEDAEGDADVVDKLRLQEEGEFLNEDNVRSNEADGLRGGGSCEEGRGGRSTIEDASSTGGREGIGYVRRRMRGGKEQPVVVCMVGEPNVRTGLRAVRRVGALMETLEVVDADVSDGGHLINTIVAEQAWLANLIIVDVTLEKNHLSPPTHPLSDQGL